MSSLLRVVFDPDTTPPGTPTILSVTPVGQGRLDITWTSATDTGGSGLAGYRLLIDGVTTLTLGIQTIYSHTGLVDASTHNYRVQAFDGNGNTSAFSTQASGTAASAPTAFNPDYPRRASYAIGGNQNSSDAALAERCVAIFAYGATWAQRKGVTLEAKASAVKALSTIGTKMVPYVIHVDVYDGFAAAGNDFYEWYTILTTNQWFVYNNGLTHDTKVVGSSSGYSKPNYTTSCPLVNGDTAFTWKAKWDYKLLYTGGVFGTGTTSVTVQGTSSLDGKFDDNIFIRERSAGDYTVDGVSDSVSSAANISLIQSSHAANLAYWKTLATSNSLLALCNFADWPAYGQTSMAGTPLDQIYDGGVHENITEYFDGPRGTTATSLFNAIKLCYDACKGPKLIILRLQLTAATDYARLRLWDCIAALTGSCLYEHVNAGYLAEELGTVNWDEKNFRLGQPSAGTAGAVQWTPQASGAYRRDFVNGIVLLNGSTSPITVALGGTFHRLLGTLDPTTNNGAPVTSVTLAAKSGIFLARVSQDTIAPSAPASLAASVVSSSQINLSWNASTDTGGSGLATYRVERSLNGTSGWAEIGTATTTTYPDSGLTASTQYFYRVRARDAVGNNSTYSNTANATTQAGSSLTALLTALFDTGTLGASCAEYNYSGKTNTAVYSNDIAGPFGEARVGKIVCTAGSNFYGGWLAGTQSVPTPVGGDLWIRAYFYFPSSFCAGYGSTSGDGFGLTKFIRIDWSTSQRMTLLVGDYSGSSCASASVSPRIALVARELQNNTNADMDNFVITRDAWHAIQLHVKFSTGTSGGIIEVWVDNHHCGRITNLSSLPNGFTTSDGLLVPGDYWNGSPRQNTAFYVSNIIVATQTPPTTDSGGRPYISPSLDARTL